MRIHTLGEIDANCFTNGPVTGVLLRASMAEIHAISQLFGEKVTVVLLPEDQVTA